MHRLSINHTSKHRIIYLLRLNLNFIQWDRSKNFRHFFRLDRWLFLLFWFLIFRFSRLFFLNIVGELHDLRNQWIIWHSQRPLVLLFFNFLILFFLFLCRSYLTRWRFVKFSLRWLLNCKCTVGVFDIFTQTDISSDHFCGISALKKFRQVKIYLLFYFMNFYRWALA